MPSTPTGLWHPLLPTTPLSQAFQAYLDDCGHDACGPLCATMYTPSRKSNASLFASLKFWTYFLPLQTFTAAGCELEQNGHACRSGKLLLLTASTASESWGEG